MSIEIDKEEWIKMAKSYLMHLSTERPFIYAKRKHYEEMGSLPPEPEAERLLVVLMALEIGAENE